MCACIRDYLASIYRANKMYLTLMASDEPSDFKLLLSSFDLRLYKTTNNIFSIHQLTTRSSGAQM